MRRTRHPGPLAYLAQNLCCFDKANKMLGTDYREALDRVAKLRGMG